MKIKTATVISLTAWVLGLLLWESQRPLRSDCQNKGERIARNLGLAIVSGVFLQLVEAPLIAWLCQRVQIGKLGLLNIVRLPKWLKALASIWSSGLTIWDKIHGTFVSFEPPHKVTVGVPAYRERAEAKLVKMLSLPFCKQRNAWLPLDRSV